MCLFLRASYLNPFVTVNAGQVAKAGIPPTVFLVRRTFSQQYGPFLFHNEGGGVKSRTAMLGHVVEEQTGIKAVERRLVSSFLSSFQSIALP